MSDSKYTVTIFVAAPGTPLLDPKTGNPERDKNDQPKTSEAGHMFYVISDGHNKPFSYGFAPIEEGRMIGPGRRVVTDNVEYKDPRYARTLEISEDQYEKLKAFGDDPERHGFDLYYKDIRHNCVDFVWAGLNQADIQRIQKYDANNEFNRPLREGPAVLTESGATTNLRSAIPLEKAPVDGKGVLKPNQNINDIRSIHAPIPDSPLNREQWHDMPDRSPIQHLLSEQDNNPWRLDPDLQRILDAAQTGNPAQIDAAMRHSAEAYLASPEGQLFTMQSEVLAQEMVAQQQQEAQQEAMQQSNPVMRMSR